MREAKLLTKIAARSGKAEMGWGLPNEGEGKRGSGV